MTSVIDCYSPPRQDKVLKDEAHWIYQHAFCKPSISQQDIADDLCAESSSHHPPSKKKDQIIAKIYNALDMIRNQKLDIPFISL